MADTKAPKAPTRPMRSDEVLSKLGLADYHTLTPDEAKRCAFLLRESDKKRKAADPDAKGIMPDRAYEKQPMDEMVDALGSIISGKADDAPASYAKAFSKEEAIQLRDALVKVVKLGRKVVTKGHVFDLRFDQRGHGWAKLTENWRKNGPKNEKGEETNVMQDEFDEYKGNPTVEIFKG